jgi:hypothetical protein
VGSNKSNIAKGKKEKSACAGSHVVTILSGAGLGGLAVTPKHSTNTAGPAPLRQGKYRIRIRMLSTKEDRQIQGGRFSQVYKEGGFGGWRFVVFPYFPPFFLCFFRSLHLSFSLPTFSSSFMTSVSHSSLLTSFLISHSLCLPLLHAR